MIEQKQTPSKVEKTKQVKEQARKISLSEFKHWLAGLSEGQPRNWVPNKRQWNLIQSKIQLIEEGVSGQSMRVTGPAGRGPYGIPPAPPIPGGVPEGVVIPTTSVPTNSTATSAGASSTSLLNQPPSDGPGSPFA